MSIVSQTRRLLHKAVAAVVLSCAAASVVGANDKVVFSPDAAQLAVTHGPDVLVFNVADGRLSRTIAVGERQNGPGGLAFSDDGRTLAVGNIQRRRGSTGYGIEFWPLDGGAPRVVPETGWAAVIVSNGVHLASIGRGFDTSVRLWKWSDGRLIRGIEVSETYAAEIAMSRGSPWIVTWSPLATRGPDRLRPAPARLWRADTGAAVASFGNLVAGKLAFAGSAQLATATAGEVAVWTLPTAAKAASVATSATAIARLHATEAMVWAVVQTTDERWIVQAWTLPALSPLTPWPVPTGNSHTDAGAFGFSNDGRLLAYHQDLNPQSANVPVRVVIIDTATGQVALSIDLPPERERPPR